PITAESWAAIWCRQRLRRSGKAAAAARSTRLRPIHFIAATATSRGPNLLGGMVQPLQNCNVWQAKFFAVKREHRARRLTQSSERGRRRLDGKPARVSELARANQPPPHQHRVHSCNSCLKPEAPGGFLLPAPVSLWGQSLSAGLLSTEREVD